MNRLLKRAVFWVLIRTVKGLGYLNNRFKLLRSLVKPVSILKMFVCLLGLFVGRCVWVIYDSDVLSTTDWVVVQIDVLGNPVSCFLVEDTTLNTEDSGVTWRDEFGSKHHISAPYRAVEVNNENWQEASQEAGLTIEACAFLKVKVLTAPPGVIVPQGRTGPAKIFGREYRNIY